MKFLLNHPRRGYKNHKSSRILRADIKERDLPLLHPDESFNRPHSHTHFYISRDKRQNEGQNKAIANNKLVYSRIISETLCCCYTVKI